VRVDEVDDTIKNELDAFLFAKPYEAPLTQEYPFALCWIANLFDQVFDVLLCYHKLDFVRSVLVGIISSDLDCICFTVKLCEL